MLLIKQGQSYSDQGVRRTGHPGTERSVVLSDGGDKNVDVLRRPDSDHILAYKTLYFRNENSPKLRLKLKMPSIDK